MDAKTMGKFIAEMRKEKGMTQRQVAEQLNISNKTVSKWECGLGCPDTSLWEELSVVLGADVLKLLQGELNPNQRDVGKLEQTQFYVCPACGNILTSTGKATISCCGRRLPALTPIPAIAGHEVQCEEIDIELYLTLNHEMSKQHYIVFVAYVCNNYVILHRLYPEQSPAVRLPVMHGGQLYLYCSKHGFQKGIMRTN